MTRFVSVPTGQTGDRAVTSISEAFAMSAGLEVLDQPATDASGRPLPDRPLIKHEPHHTSAKSAAKHDKGGTVASTPEEASK